MHCRWRSDSENFHINGTHSETMFEKMLVLRISYYAQHWYFEMKQRYLKQNSLILVLFQISVSPCFAKIRLKKILQSIYLDQNYELSKLLNKNISKILKHFATPSIQARLRLTTCLSLQSIAESL